MINFFQKRCILYRTRNYDFDKALYVTSYEQVLHFKQVFETAKLLGLNEKYTNGLEHVSFGMVLLPTGKMSTREGTIVKLEELLLESIERAKKVIESKNPDLENKEDVAKKVGIGAVIFNDLANNRIKDEIFDWDQILNFQGETGPYIQYTYVRTKSIIEKVGMVSENVNVQYLQDMDSQNVLKLLYNFGEVLEQVTEKNEPSILSRYLIELSKAFSSFYNEKLRLNIYNLLYDHHASSFSLCILNNMNNLAHILRNNKIRRGYIDFDLDEAKVIVDDEEAKNARVFLTYAVGKVLKIGAGLLGIQMPEKM
mgnify:CR=1 FL=1